MAQFFDAFYSALFFRPTTIWRFRAAMTVQPKVTMALIGSIFVANAALSLAGLESAERAWLREMQHRPYSWCGSSR